MASSTEDTVTIYKHYTYNATRFSNSAILSVVAFYHYSGSSTDKRKQLSLTDSLIPFSHNITLLQNNPTFNLLMQNKRQDFFFITIIYNFANVPSITQKSNESQVSCSQSLHNTPIKTN